MMRSLWTAASGMKAEQTSVDTIANNIANVNTTGYKSQSTQFKSLLYQTLQAETTTANGETKPTGAQVGLGTRVASINSSFREGAMLTSDNPTALYIRGQGFFAVRGADGQRYYSRDGNLTFVTSNRANTLVLTNASGNQVEDVEGNPITLPYGASAESVSIGKDGTVSYLNADGTLANTGQRIALYQFPNPTGLEKTSNNMYRVTEASGNAINEATTNLNITPSEFAQGYIEGSNVNVADEMVNLIISQRAYELNSRAITTSDSMLQTANQLKQ